MYHKDKRCPRCEILVTKPGLCKWCANPSPMIAYFIGESPDDRFWRRRFVRSSDILQDEEHEKRAAKARDKRAKEREKRQAKRQGRVKA